jgi:hypothetical protein
MALKNLEIWHGTWRVETQHYRGKLIIGDNIDAAENYSLNGKLVLHKEHHEKPEYTFRLSIPLQTVETDTIVFGGKDQRDGMKKAMPLKFCWSAIARQRERKTGQSATFTGSRARTARRTQAAY